MLEHSHPSIGYGHPQLLHGALKQCNPAAAAQCKKCIQQYSTMSHIFAMVGELGASSKEALSGPDFNHDQPRVSSTTAIRKRESCVVDSVDCNCVLLGLNFP